MTSAHPRLVLVTALGCLLALAPAPAFAGDVRDFLFLGGAPPVRIRIEVRIGDRPMETAWLEAIGKIHAHLDADSDGRLTIAEANRVEWPRFFLMLRTSVRSPYSPAFRSVAGREPPEAVSIDQLANLFRSQRSPISIETRAPSAADQDTTFSLFDVNRDGALTPDELSQSLDALRLLDQNDDETISLAEQAPLRGTVIAGTVITTRSNGADSGLPPMLIDAGDARTRTSQILNRYDVTGASGTKTPPDHRLSRTEIGLHADVFAAYDGNDDELLDADEVGAYLDALEPSVALMVRLGPSVPGHFRVEVVTTAGDDCPGVPRVRVRRVDDTLTTLDLGNRWIDLRIPDTTGDRARSRQLNRSLFMTLAKGADNTLSMNDVRGREPFQSLFALMDRDTDGKVTEAELNAAIDVLEEPSLNQAVFGVADRGEMLFGTIDADSDGRLGLRELLAARKRLASYDLDRDGRITAAEIPHRYDWVISLVPMTLGFAVVSTVNGMPQAAPARPADGPAWFTKMDRNRDGDLSPREFIGPRGVFRRLDVDGDGLIDASEAKGAGKP
jgi:Ca2+-binding EF-hand superfamily protein